MNYFTGQILLFAGLYVPQGFAACNGQALSVQAYPQLYALIGNAYGGDQTRFNLPDLRGRLPLGSGQGVTSPKDGGGAPLTAHALAASGGAETVSLKVSDIPSHTHTVNALNASATTNQPQGNMLAKVPSGTAFYLTDQPGGAVPTPAALGRSALAETGGNLPHDNIMPVLPLTYIMCTSGLFPDPA